MISIQSTFHKLQMSFINFANILKASDGLDGKMMFKNESYETT